MAWHSERGSYTIEWGGLLILVALMMLAMLAAGVPQALGRSVSCAVHQAFGGTGACPAAPAAGAPPSAQAPWNSPNPVTRATWGTYVSLGDSYSAGEGLGDYEPGSSVHQSQCRASVFGACVYHKDPKVIVGCDRSGHAYNSTVSSEYTFQDGKQTWACSGSITKDIYDPNNPTCSAGHASGPYGEGCQANRVNANTSLITMSIGGNDAGFADDLKSCYENRAKLHWSQACSYEAQTINTKIAGIKPNLIADLKALHARAPHARIILITYPKLFRRPADGQRGMHHGRARLPDSGGSVVLQPGGGQAGRHDLCRCSSSRRRRASASTPRTRLPTARSAGAIHASRHPARTSAARPGSGSTLAPTTRPTVVSRSSAS